MRHDIDYHAIFSTLPEIVVILDQNYQILDVNAGFLDATGSQPGDVLGRYAFDVFPANPADPIDGGPRTLRSSLDLVLATAEPDTICLLRYDVEDPGRPGIFEQRYWSVVSSPLTGDDGKVRLITVCAREVTPIISQINAEPSNA